MLNLKLLIPISIVLISLSTSCSKGKKECELKSKYIYEPLVIDETCNCIVSGKVKYLEDCETVALVDYGNGECDNIATKTVCKNGNCEAKAGAYTEEFEFNCDETVEEGSVSDKEAASLGI